MEEEWTAFIPFFIEIVVAGASLFMIKAGNGESGVIYGIGIAIFALAFICGLWSIKRFFDRAETRRRRG